MKKFTFSFLLLVWICSNIQVVAQQKMEQVRQDGVYYFADQMPVYPGGQAAIMQYLTKEVKYPAEALKKGISGNVLVQFVVGKKGKLSDFKVIRGVDSLLDAEALRAVKRLPGKWIAGRNKGKRVRVLYTIPVNFRTSRPENRPALGNDLKVNKNIKAPLEGIWQICTSVKPLGYGKYEIETGLYWKILSSDKNFVNMDFDQQNGRSLITTAGTYNKTSDATYVENIVKSVAAPELAGVANTLEFGFLSENLLVVSYQMPNRPTRGTEIWVRVVQPELKQPEILPAAF